MANQPPTHVQVTVISTVPEIPGDAKNLVVRRTKESGTGKVVDSRLVFAQYNKSVHLFHKLITAC